MTPTRTALAAAAVATSWLAACATPLDEARVEPMHAQQRWLPAIVADATPVGALERSFGPPTATFERGRLRCWALMLVEKGLAVDVDDDGRMRPQPAVDRGSGAARTARREAIDAAGELRAVTAADVAARALWPVWREAEFHLVAVVDEEGLVSRWSFVRVLP